MTVCIIDDSAVALSQLTRVLAQAGVTRTKAFRDPHEALTWCRLHAPDLVLLDYSMPGMDGLDFLDEFRQLPGMAKTPVAMISGWAVDSLRVSALRAGAVDVIEKPFRPDELKLKVRNLLRLSEAPAPGGEGLSGAGEAGTPAAAPDRSIMLLERMLSIRTGQPPGTPSRTGRYASAIAAELGCDRALRDGLLQAAAYHDLGAWVLASSPAEQARHPASMRDAVIQEVVASQMILDAQVAPVLRLAAELALSFREHWDGSGLPQGLAGTEIPLSGRIFAVAHMFEAISTAALKRDIEDACATAAHVIRDDDGRHFDPSVVAAMTRAWPELLRIARGGAAGHH